MFAAILSWFLGGGLSSITSALTDAYRAKLAAANEADRIAADEMIAQLQAQRDVMAAEAGKFSLDGLMRLLFAMPFAVYYAKLVLIDKVLCSITGCSWSTDALSPNLTAISGIVISFFFVHAAITSFTK